MTARCLLIIHDRAPNDRRVASGTVLLLNNAFGLTVSDAEGRLIQVNRVFCEMLGRSAAELLGRAVRDLTHPADRPEDARGHQRLIETEEGFTTVKRFFRADGTALWVQAYVSLLRDAGGGGTVSAMIRPILPGWEEAAPEAAHALSEAGPWPGVSIH